MYLYILCLLREVKKSLNSSVFLGYIYRVQCSVVLQISEVAQGRLTCLSGTAQGCGETLAWLPVTGQLQQHNSQG